MGGVSALTDLAKRGPLGLKQPKQDKKPKPMRQISAKKAAYRASKEGKAGLDYMARVKGLPCVICGAFPVEVHHCFHGRYGTRRASDFDTIPLCLSHHRNGPEAIHNGKATWAAKHGPDYGYIAQVRAALGVKG